MCPSRRFQIFSENASFSSTGGSGGRPPPEVSRSSGEQKQLFAPTGTGALPVGHLAVAHPPIWIAPETFGTSHRQESFKIELGAHITGVRQADGGSLVVRPGAPQKGSRFQLDSLVGFGLMVGGQENRGA